MSFELWALSNRAGEFIFIYNNNNNYRTYSENMWPLL
jgi:hypothetical protein